MSVGGFISDLEAGDVLRPVTFTIDASLARAFCHGFEETSEWFHGAGLGDGPFAPPTWIHAAKARLLKASCPRGDGPAPKLLVEYDAVHHAPVPVGEPLAATGEVVDRYVKRGREYLHVRIELRRAADGRLLIAYADRMLLGRTTEAASR